MRDRGCRRVAVLHDGEVFGYGAAQLFRAFARVIPKARLFASDGVAERAFMRGWTARRAFGLFRIRNRQLEYVETVSAP
jgi:hypothetical protein